MRKRCRHDGAGLIARLAACVGCGVRWTTAVRVAIRSTPSFNTRGCLYVVLCACVRIRDVVLIPPRIASLSCRLSAFPVRGFRCAQTSPIVGLASRASSGRRGMVTAIDG